MIFSAESVDFIGNEVSMRTRGGAWDVAHNINSDSGVAHGAPTGRCFRGGAADASYDNAGQKTAFALIYLFKLKI